MESFFVTLQSPFAYWTGWSLGLVCFEEVRMTVQEVMNNLSDTLLCDDRILSMPERELLATLLRRANSESGSKQPLAENIASAVGQIIAERAYGILGNRVVETLLKEPTWSSRFPSRTIPVIRAGTPPTTPPGPVGPGVGPRPPGPGPSGGGPSFMKWAGTPPTTPPSPGPDAGPRPPGPGPSGPGITDEAMQTGAGGVATLEMPEILPARPLIFNEFLAPAELEALMRYTLERETQFQVSEVISPGVGGVVDYEQRRSRVLMDLSVHKDVIVNRLRASFPRILRMLDHAPFTIARAEAQITASNHGDFFRSHSDNAQDEVASREITFVYFFHHEPKRFSGGELRIYDSRWENNSYAPTANCHTIVPEQNEMVLFNSSLAHEITPVECSTRAFADGRFTVNGWLHR